MAKVLRWEIPINDKDHIVSFAGEITGEVAVTGTPVSPKLEFWTFEQVNAVPGDKVVDRIFRVFGTGVEVPINYAVMGTTPRTVTGQVWHLFERI